MALVRSSIWFTIGTFLSRISGLVRDMILSGVFGASAAMDAFVVANRIPNLFRDMLAEGALGSSFTKVYTEVSVRDRERGHRLLCAIFRLGFVFLILSSIVGYFCAPILVDAFTYFGDTQIRGPSFRRETVILTQVLFPFLGFAILAALAGGVLQTEGKFFLVAVSSSALNVGYIVGALSIAALFNWLLPAEWDQLVINRSILGLAVGVVIGGFLHFAIQFATIWREYVKEFGWKYDRQLISKDIWQVMTLMLPAAIAASAGTINLLVNTNFATSLPNGSVTWLNYAFRLLQLPIGIFAVAVSSVTLPALTRSIEASNRTVTADVLKQLLDACLFIVWLMLPCLVFLLFFSQPTIEFLFQHGKFDAASTKATADALWAYSFGVLGYGVVKVMSSFYYASGRTRFAMNVSLGMIAINFVLNWFLVQKYQHVGLALTTSFTLSLNALALFWGLPRDAMHSLNIAAEIRRFLFPLGVALAAGILGYAANLWLIRTGVLAGFPVKLSSAIEICTGSIVVVGCFALGAMQFFQVGPTEALQWYRNRKLRRIKE